MIAAEQLNIGRGRVRSREITARTLGASAGGRRRAGTAEGWAVPGEHCPDAALIARIAWRMQKCRSFDLARIEDSWCAGGTANRPSAKITTRRSVSPRLPRSLSRPTTRASRAYSACRGNAMDQRKGENGPECYQRRQPRPPPNHARHLIGIGTAIIGRLSGRPSRASADPSIAQRPDQGSSSNRPATKSLTVLKTEC
jgi:hypothetical protein